LTRIWVINEARIHADLVNQTKRGFTRIWVINEARIHANQTKRGFTRIWLINGTRDSLFLTRLLARAPP
jgi:hypothetical protein